MILVESTTYALFSLDYLPPPVLDFFQTQRI